MSLLVDLLPAPRVAALSVSSGLLAALLVGWAAARLHARGMRTPYTRKIFHFGIFSGAAVVHATLGLPGTNAYGATVAAIVLWAVQRGDGHPLLEALARDSDRPHRRLFVVVPLLTTAIGGLASALIAGPFAAVGYLVAGWGDAVGEPVGTRWGRHSYRVPSLAGVAARRTVEGSAAVLVVGCAAALVALLAVGYGFGEAWPAALVVGAGGAAVEAVSHHGTDNLTVQLAASLSAMALLR